MTFFVFDDAKVELDNNKLPLFGGRRKAGRKSNVGVKLPEVLRTTQSTKLLTYKDSCIIRHEFQL